MGLVVKSLKCRRCKRCGLDPWRKGRRRSSGGRTATHSSSLAWRIPTDWGACQAIVLRVAKNGTWLKWLSTRAYTRGKMQKSNLKDEIRCSSCKQLNCLIQNENTTMQNHIYPVWMRWPTAWCGITVTIGLSSHVPLGSESEYQSYSECSKLLEGTEEKPKQILVP